MIVFTSLDTIPRSFGPAVASIGNFDGVHRGHCFILDQLRTRAQAQSLRSLAITFEPHPVRLLRPEAPHSLITPLAQKLDLLAATGIDATLVLPFTPTLAALTPDAFVQQVLCDACSIREIHEGELFRFGYRGAGTMQTLAELGRQLGFSVHPHAPLVVRGEPISSSRVRALIAVGDVSGARGLLGRAFSIRSTPASGRGYGTRYTVPTINLAPYPELLPGNGVYITTLRVGDRPFQAVTNVGNRPTFGADSFTVESHLLDFQPVDLNEETPLELTFLRRLRGEHRFPSPEALREQIGRDVARAQRFFRLAPTIPRA